MTGIRRALVLIGLTLAVMIGAAIPASATFADSVTVKTAVTTGTVAAPAGVTVNDWCTTTTVTTKRTVRTDPVTGVQTQTAWSRTTSSTASTSNIDSYTSTTVSGPGAGETTTTTVEKDTELYVSVSWASSGSRGVTGYAVTAHLIGMSSFVMGTTAGTTMSGSEDADVLAYGPRLSVTTLTSYGWTAETPRTRVLTC
jgi:hypothetical protein